MKKNNFIINILIILIVLIIVLYFSLKDDYVAIINAIQNMKMIYIIIAILVLIIYRALISYTHYLLIKQNNEHIPYLKMLQINFIILFFHGVTPFAGGGQPMEVYYLHKEGIGVTKATNITLQNFIMFQISLVLTGIIALVYNRIFKLFPNNQLISQLVVLGFLINFLILIATYVISFGKRINKFILEKGIHFLAKIKIIKKEAEVQERFKDYITRFQKNALVFKNKKHLIIKYVFINTLGLIILYAMPAAIAAGLGESISIPIAMTTTAYVMIIGSYVPIPGGTGGIEYSFMFFYSTFIKGSILNAIMLVWRFVSYYLGMIIGAIALALYGKKEKKCE